MQLFNSNILFENVFQECNNIKIEGKRLTIQKLTKNYIKIEGKEDWPYKN